MVVEPTSIPLLLLGIAGGISGSLSDIGVLFFDNIRIRMQMNGT
jgi:hypothetical protein